MNDMVRAAREGFLDSLNLAGALTIALGKAGAVVMGVFLAFVHHEPVAPNDASEKADPSRSTHS